MRNDPARGSEHIDIKRGVSHKRVTKPHSRMNEDSRAQKMYETPDKRYVGRWDEHIGLEDAMDRFTALYGESEYYNVYPRRVPKGGKGTGNKARTVDDVNRRG